MKQSVGAGCAVIALLLLAGCGGKNACEKAGGRCDALTPGVCLNQVVGDAKTYACDKGAAAVCCLPLSYSKCEDQGGLCVPQSTGACANGTIGDPSTYSCGNGATLECCLSP